MAELRELFTTLGYRDVRTYIQSGNVVFDSNARPAPGARVDAMSQRFGINSDVVVLSAESLVRTVKNNPLDAGEPSKIHVGFAGRLIERDRIGVLETDRFLPEQCKVVGFEIFSYLPDGMGRARLPVYLERRVTVPVTYRNWTTVNKLFGMVSSIDDEPERR